MKECIGTICCDECGYEIEFNKDDVVNELTCEECNTLYNVKKIHGTLIISKV